MNKTVQIIISFSLVVLNLSCTKHDSITGNSTINTTMVIPLNSNNQWNYTYQRYNYLNTVTYTSDTTLRIQKDTILLGERRYQFSKIAEVFSNLYWYNQGAQGFQVLTYTSSIIDSSLIFQFPAIKDTTYKTKFFYTWSVISTDTTIEIGSTKYKCIYYRYNHAVAPDEYFIAPGIGVVKINELYQLNPGESNYPGFRLNEVYTLKNYKIY